MANTPVWADIEVESNSYEMDFRHYVHGDNGACFTGEDRAFGAIFYGESIQCDGAAIINCSSISYGEPIQCDDATTSKCDNNYSKKGNKMIEKLLSSQDVNTRATTATSIKLGLNIDNDEQYEGQPLQRMPTQAEAEAANAATADNYSLELSSRTESLQMDVAKIEITISTWRG